MGYEIENVADGIWMIQDNTVRMFLLDGGTESFLLDTGYGTGDLAALTASLTKGDIIVINTHSHADHTSANWQFRKFYCHEADAREIRAVCGDGAQIHLVNEHEILRAGTRQLEVVTIPGHTPGSIALLDRRDRILFSSDAVAKNFPIYMQFPGQDLQEYLRSLRKIESMQDLFDRICPCHGDFDIDKSYIGRTIHCVEGILGGSIPEGTAQNAAGVLERAYTLDGVTIFH